VIKLYQVLVSLLPVLAFLGALVVLDSFKLVSFRAVLRAIFAGALAAVASLWLNELVLHTWRPEFKFFSRYDAPLVEEMFKGAYVGYLLWSRRVGFIVDAVIYAFAVGTGFALVENVYFLKTLASDQPLVWVVRGFGTAALHGATMVCFAALTKHLLDRQGERRAWHFVPGFMAAAVLHSLFNHFLLSPVASTLVLLVVLPVLIVVVFARSERATGEWLGEGWQADVDLLEAVTSDELAATHVGFYLDNLREHFPPEVVGDMLSLIQLHLELAMTAKGMLLAKAAGVTLPKDPDVEAKIRELAYLERSIGKTGLRTLKPLLYATQRDEWQRVLLAG
jgi:RsiW-degrading membrane proteinase PrsW (M82 family)